MTKSFKRFAVLFMAVCLIAGSVFSVSSVKAATKKVTAKHSFEKCPSVKAGKNYLVTSDEYSSEKGLTYVKFKAPSDGKYVFTLQNLTKHGESTNDVIMNGTASLRAFQSEYETMPSSIKIKYGKEETYSLCLCSRYTWEISPDDKIDVYTYLPKRQVTLKLNEGTTIYVAFNFIDKCDVNLKIKKK